MFGVVIISNPTFDHSPPPSYSQGHILIGGGGGANTDRVAKGHCEGEGAGGGCAKLKLPPFYKVNGKLKRGPLIICTCSCCVALSMEKKFSSSGQGGQRNPPLKYGPV